MGPKGHSIVFLLYMWFNSSIVVVFFIFDIFVQLLLYQAVVVVAGCSHQPQVDVTSSLIQ